jgi:hypothetical protein
MFSGQQKIYLACPYTHKHFAIRQCRFKKVSKFAATLMGEGHLVFSPISHSHQICVEADLPIEYDYWQELDQSFLEWCTVMVVLKLDGWEDSEGIQEEIKIAQFMGKEVIYMEYKL